MSKRKHATINMITFYNNFDPHEWNKFLSRCVKKKDVNKLISTLYGLQAGMKDLADEKLNSDKMIAAFLRVQRSIENTLKEIYRDEFSNPLYDPANKHLRDQFIEDKRAKDNDFERILKDNRF